MGKTDFCGHNKGTFLISGLKSKLVSDVKGGMCMERLNRRKNLFIGRNLCAFKSIYGRYFGSIWFYPVSAWIQSYGPSHRGGPSREYLGETLKEWFVSFSD